MSREELNELSNDDYDEALINEEDDKSRRITLNENGFLL